MSISRTVNSDKRYYLDESLINNADSFLSTMKLFNLAKIDLYNEKFELKYFDDGILKTKTYSKFLKDKYHLDAYYQASIHSAVNGQLSSQTELQKFYKQCYEADIKTRQEKIKKAEEELVKKQGVKESLVTYVKTGRWVKPYSKCQLKVCGSYVQGPGIKGKEDILVYERRVESCIRKLKNRIKHLKYGLQQKQRKTDNLTTKPQRESSLVPRSCFQRKMIKIQIWMIGAKNLSSREWIL